MAKPNIYPNLTALLADQQKYNLRAGVYLANDGRAMVKGDYVPIPKDNGGWVFIGKLGTILDKPLQAD